MKFSIEDLPDSASDDFIFNNSLNSLKGDLFVELAGVISYILE